VLCVSEPVAAWVRDVAGNEARVHTLSNGVDTSRVLPARRPVAPAVGAPFTIGFVGTLKPWHGVETLLDAFAELVATDPSYRLLLVGDGPLAETVRAGIAGADLGARVRMTGAVEPGAVPALLRRMDVAVAPYPRLDAFYFSPLKVYEYLAAGLPVVASRVGALAEILDHGRLGVLVEPGDVHQLADALAALRADPVRRSRLRELGRRSAVEQHDWSRIVQTALALAGVCATEAVTVQPDEEARRAVAG
jgi:glycosyltransferase involved in cell wall biosynthesis